MKGGRIRVSFADKLGHGLEEVQNLDSFFSGLRTVDFAETIVIWRRSEVSPEQFGEETLSKGYE